MSKPPAPRLTPTRRDAVETRACLLQAAAVTFAEYGYKDASLRQICTKADVNLGSVKYYFGSKQALYRELLLGAHKEMLAKDTMPTLETADSAEQALSQWIAWFLGMIISRGQYPTLGKIMAREITQPTPTLDDLIREVMLEVRQELERIISALTGPECSATTRNHLTSMTIMLCTMHDIAQPILEKFGYRPPKDKSDLKDLAKIVSSYALAGIRNAAASNYLADAK
ncbi:MAG: CerR family C-terminal domain-containing protein [Rhodospirillales bacterium]|jgi:TetR/AcrR family transcriptional regulator, regulator of cefoperazone and chloramphenicol sensitivity|nr:CerR family C-terminal domain-containing protein [Rhodospirillales bacterium]